MSSSQKFLMQSLIAVKAVALMIYVTGPVLSTKQWLPRLQSVACGPGPMWCSVREGFRFAGQREHTLLLSYSHIYSHIETWTSFFTKVDN